jgi:hypothetical protein
LSIKYEFKTFTKVGTNHLTGLAHRVINQLNPLHTRKAGRSILGGVMVLKETIHELHRKKMGGVLFKIYFWKAYDKVNGHFYSRPYA